MMRNENKRLWFLCLCVFQLVYFCLSVSEIVVDFTDATETHAQFCGYSFLLIFSCFFFSFFSFFVQVHSTYSRDWDLLLCSVRAHFIILCWVCCCYCHLSKISYRTYTIFCQTDRLAFVYTISRKDSFLNWFHADFSFFSSINMRSVFFVWCCCLNEIVRRKLALRAYIKMGRILFPNC